jgi:F1F0 ATPase subunit 2
MKVLYLAFAFIIGAGLGYFYFGTLWWTVKRLHESRYPALLAFGSLIGRIAVTLLVFYFVMGGHWERLIACLVGFIVARIVLVRRWRPKGEEVPAE